MSARAVIVNGNNRIDIAFYHCANCISSTFLHFGIRTLNCVKFYSGAKSSCIGRRNGRATHSNSIIFSTKNNDFVAFLWFVLFCLLFFSVTNSTCQHNHFIKTQFSTCPTELVEVFMLKCQNRTSNQWLSKFISKIGSSIGGFYQNIHRCLVQPFSFVHSIFPRAIFC